MRLNLKSKFVMAAMLISITSIYFISRYMTDLFTAQHWKLTSDSNRQILDQLSQNLNLYLDEIYRLTLIPYYNKDLMNILKTEPETLAERQNKRRIIEEFLIGSMVFPRQDIQRVSILSDALYFSDRIASGLPTYTEAKNSSWYHDIISAGKPLIVLPNGNSRYFSITNVIRDLMDNTSILGVIKVDADYTTIRNICESADINSNDGVIILSNQDKIVYSSFNLEQSQFILDDIKKLAVNNTITSKSILSQSYLYNTVTLNMFSWQMIMANSLDNIRNIYVYNRKITIFLVVVVIVIILILMYFLMQYLLSPLYSIIKLMKKIEKGDSMVRYIGKTDDEIGHLGTAMNTMLDRMDEMHKKNVELDKSIYRARLFQRETQILLLYSQIRPHFIYNALNMISTLIQKNQRKQAVDNINKLSLILRGIAYINKEIPIGTELKLVESYLAIQQSRYSDRLTYSINVDKKLYDYLLPALILQPLVENAVIHNSEGTRKQTYISIYNEVSEDTFAICIVDNGRGISSEKLAEIEEQIQNGCKQESSPIKELSSARGLGLINVNTRIQMRFGKEYGVSINSQTGNGTIVKVVLPLNWKEAEDIDSNTNS